MTPIRQALMLREAATRLNAADLLRDAGDESDSAHLLRLLAFELLLKAALEKATGSSGAYHKYDKLFAALPSGIPKLGSVCTFHMGVGSAL